MVVAKGNITKSSIELVIFLLGLWGMGYATLFQDVSQLNPNRVTVAYQYKPLVLDTSAVDKSDYVIVKTGNGRKPAQCYTFYTQGEKDIVPGDSATVSARSHPINLVASSYKVGYQES